MKFFKRLWFQYICSLLFDVCVIQTGPATPAPGPESTPSTPSTPVTSEPAKKRGRPPATAVTDTVRTLSVLIN